MLQQKLDTNVTNSQKAAYEIQELRKALEASNNHATDIHQQAVAHVQRVEEAASQEVQRLTELGRSHDRRRASVPGSCSVGRSSNQNDTREGKDGEGSGQQMRPEDNNDTMASNVKAEVHLEPRRR